MEFLSDIRDFEVWVDNDLWESVKKQDDAAIDQLKNRIDGLVVYFHIFHPKPNDVPVSIDDLIKYNVIESLTIHTHDIG